jgi:hypothetical protein
MDGVCYHRTAFLRKSSASTNVKYNIVAGRAFQSFETKSRNSLPCVVF